MNPRRSELLVQRALLATITMLSGAAALAFETLWTRSFSLVLGSTVQAASAVFAAFLTGLALGAWVGGRWTTALRRPLLAYALLEFGIGLTAGLIGLALHWHGAALAGQMRVMLEWNRALAAFLSALGLILAPTFLMGMTFPWILTVAKRHGSTAFPVPLIYGANTFGAAVGTLACGFVFIRCFGIQNSLIVSSALNLLTGLLAFWLLRLSRPACEEGEPAGNTPLPIQNSGPGVSECCLTMATALSGFLTLGVEIVWLRYSSYFLGNRTYAFSIMLAAILVLLAVGSWIAEWVRRKRWALNALLGGVFLVSFLGIMISAEIVNYWIAHQDLIEPLLPGGDTYVLGYRSLEAILSLVLVLVPLGVLFPLCLTLAKQSRRWLGLTSGRYYLINTVGAVIGSVLTGFWGMSYAGANGWSRLLAFICLGSALVFFLVEAKMGSSWIGRLGALGALLGGGLFTWPSVPLQYIHPGERLLFRKEDEYGVLQVAMLPDGHLARVSNNKTDLVFLLGSPETDYVQQMQAHLAMFHAPHAKRVAVLGSGYGITAGAFAAYSDLVSIEAVEILPIMLEVASQFSAHNLDYDKDPRVRLVVDDGRHFLARKGATYDIISVNVSDPRLPGGSALFHREFYDLVKRRLNRGGLVLQHIFGNQRRTALTTLASSFQHVRLFPAYQNGFNAVASDEPLLIDEVELARLASQPRVKAALAKIGVVPPLGPMDIINAQIDSRRAVVLLDRHGPIASDDYPRVEFSWSDNAVENLHSNE